MKFDRIKFSAITVCAFILFSYGSCSLFFSPPGYDEILSEANNNNSNRNSNGNPDTNENISLSGDYSENIVIPEDSAVQMSGVVKIKSGFSITIEKGAVFKADSTIPTVLVIETGATIMANGSLEKPIVFTSDKEEGKRLSGDWVGIAINGLSHLNTIGGPGNGLANGEAGSGLFGGGENPVLDDDSGVLNYIRIEFAGNEYLEIEDTAGLMLQAVGSGTKISNVQIHKSFNDGLRVIGGTVNVNNIFLSSIEDESLEWNLGWTGSAKNVVILLNDGDKAIEGFNSDLPNVTPRSAPTLENFSIIGGVFIFDKIIEVEDGSTFIFKNSYIAAVCFVDSMFSLETTDVSSEFGSSFLATDNIFEGNVKFDATEGDCSTNPDIDSILVLKNADGPVVDSSLEDQFFQEDTNEIFPEVVFLQINSDFAVNLKPNDDLVKAQVAGLGNYIGAVGLDDWTLDWTTDVAN